MGGAVAAMHMRAAACVMSAAAELRHRRMPHLEYEYYY